MLQNKIIKVVLRSFRLTHTKEIHYNAGILLFKDRISFNQLKFINRNLTDPSSLFHQHRTSSLTTRSVTQAHIALPTPNITTFRKSFCYLGIVQ